MAFKMNKPSITQGTTAYKSALKHMIPGGVSHSHEGGMRHEHTTDSFGETTEYALDDKGNTIGKKRVEGQVEKETEDNSTKIANQENNKRLRTQEEEQKGNEMSGVNSGVKKTGSALPRKGVRKGVKTTSHSTKSTRASHQREASLGDKKLNRMNKRLSRQYAKKGDAVTERGSLYDRTNKQFSKAYASATASDKAKYEAKVAKNKDRVDTAKANKNK